MSKRLEFFGSLFYFDGIQVFEARDAIGGHYIGVLLADELPGDDLQYAIVGVNPKTLQEFRLGKVDLASIMRNSPDGQWYIGTIQDTAEDRCVVTADLRSGDIPNAYLPDDGFFLSISPEINAQDVARESVTRNVLALEVSLESNSLPSQNRIGGSALGGFLISIQSLLKSAYRKAKRMGDKSDRPPLIDVAVPAIAGSFKVLFVPHELPDLFNQSEVGKALEIVDYLFEQAANTEKTVGRVQEYRGHTAGSFIRLVRFMIESDVAISYAWASPDRPGVSIRRISRPDAGTLLEALSATESIGVEKLTVAGRLQRIDLNQDTWQLIAEDGQKFSGKCKEGVSLKGLTTDEFYIFDCEEEIMEVPATGKEIKTLYLTMIEQSKKS